VQAFEKLAGLNLPLPHRELLEDEMFTPYTLNRIEKAGWIESVDLPVESEPDHNGSVTIRKRYQNPVRSAAGGI
jgi:primosomal protein N' (replication factor Y) (superfamily II helicase)